MIGSKRGGLGAAVLLKLSGSKFEGVRSLTGRTVVIGCVPDPDVACGIAAAVIIELGGGFGGGCFNGHGAAARVRRKDNEGFHETSLAEVSP